MTLTIINNLPKNVTDYKYIVAREVNGEWWFYGAYNEGSKAEQAAVECGGEIFI